MYASSRRGNSGLRFGTKIAVTIAHAMNVIATMSSTVLPSLGERRDSIARTLPRSPRRATGGSITTVENVNRVQGVTPDERLDRYARLAVEVAVNLQPGQFLRISADPEHLPLVRAIGRIAYEQRRALRRGALPRRAPERARVEHAPDDSLDWSPPWTVALIDHMVDTRGATIAITGDSEPELLADVDQRRAQRARPWLAAEKLLDAENRRLIQWTIVGYPNEGWAEPSSASPTSSGSGTPSIDRDATRRARPGRRVARAPRTAPAAGGDPRRARLSTRSASSGRAPISSSACPRGIAG